MKEFNVGQVVQLKSGGPRMTIVKVPTGFSGEVICAWFAVDGTMQTNSLPFGALKKDVVDRHFVIGERVMVYNQTLVPFAATVRGYRDCVEGCVRVMREEINKEYVVEIGDCVSVNT